MPRQQKARTAGADSKAAVLPTLLTAPKCNPRDRDLHTPQLSNCSRNRQELAGTADRHHTATRHASSSFAVQPTFFFLGAGCDDLRRLRRAIHRIRWKCRLPWDARTLGLLIRLWPQIRGSRDARLPAPWRPRASTEGPHRGEVTLRLAPLSLRGSGIAPTSQPSARGRNPGLKRETAPALPDPLDGPSLRRVSMSRPRVQGRMPS